MIRLRAISIIVRPWRRFLVACILCQLYPALAGASDLNPSAPPEAVLPARAPAVLAFDKTSMYELRFGPFWHGPGGDEGKKYSVDVNAELVFPRLPFSTGGWIDWFIPRPMVGVMGSTAGKTSFGYVSMVWTWQWKQFFFEPILGAAFHNGYLDNPPPDRVALGCNPLFHTGLSIGYDLTPQWSIMGTWQHISNGGLCHRNIGLNTYGIRLGYSFTPPW